MNVKPKAEALFESFCDGHELLWEKITPGENRRPDYLLSMNGQSVYCEIKQIDKDSNFQKNDGVSSRTVGSHIRQKISDAKKQIQLGAKIGAPSILLVYNNLDPMQFFGTEQHDFIAAMYGELTVVVKDTRIVDSYQGRNSSLRSNHNTSFSAIGHIRQAATGPIIRLYGNVFACNPLNVELLPQCFEFVHVAVDRHAA